MKEVKISVLALAVAGGTLLTGCGGGGSGSEPTSSQTVTAIDGYLAGADVYIDDNENGVLDALEADAGPIGSTNKSGQIAVADETFAKALLVKAVAGKTIDSDSGIVDRDFVLGAPTASSFVTPFTHISAKTGESAEVLAERLGLDVSLVTGDYVKPKTGTDTLAEQAKVAHALARFIVTEVKQANVTEDTISSFLGDAKTQIETLITGGADADLIEVELEDTNNTIVEAPTTKLAFSESELTEAPNWTMFRFDDAGDNEQFYIRFGTTSEPSAFCMNNEALSGFQADPSIIEPDDTCVAEADFSVNPDGKLVVSWDNVDGSTTTFNYTMLYRHTETISADFDYRVFVMVADNGELFWVDNNSFIDDAGDYVIEKDVIKFVFQDDNGDRDVIENILGQATFEVTGQQEYTVSGSPQALNFGNLTLGAIGSTAGGETSFKTVPLYEMSADVTASADDILITVEEASTENDEHWLFDYRTAGALRLVLDYKPNNPSQSLYLESESQALIEFIAGEVISRDSGTQGDF